MTSTVKNNAYTEHITEIMTYGLSKVNFVILKDFDFMCSNANG